MVRYKVINDRRHDIGLALPGGMERVVKAQSYAILTRDEIDHLASIAPTLFAGEKRLRLEDRKLAVEMGFIQSEDQPVFDEGFIRKQLGLRTAQMKAWLDGIQEPHLLDEVLRVAQQMDLPSTKLQVLQERCPDKPLVVSESE